MIPNHQDTTTLVKKQPPLSDTAGMFYFSYTNQYKNSKMHQTREQDPVIGSEYTTHAQGHNMIVCIGPKH